MHILLQIAGASSNALFFISLEPFAWQREEASCGGPLMTEAIIFEWTSAANPAKHKDFTIEWGDA